MRYTITGIGLLLPVLLVIAFLRIPAYLSNRLPEWVANKSDNLYQLKFEKIAFTTNGLSLSFRGVELNPDSSISFEILKEKPSRIFYSFNSPEIQINHISLIRFLKDKSLTCRELKIVRPRLDLRGNSSLQTDSVPSFRYLFRELTPLLGSRINEISIGEIELADASYELYRFLGDSSGIARAEKIDVAIKNFRTDSLLVNNPSMPFESDDIELKMKNLKIQMGDSLHISLIDSLVYSLKHSEIRAAGFHLYPEWKNPRQPLYEVDVPEFRLKSHSILNFRITDSLDIDSLKFISPRLRYYSKTNPEKVSIEDLNNFDLYLLVNNQFRSIRINSFLLTGASLEIYRQPQTNNYQQRFDKINIQLADFSLDSLSGRDPERLFHAGEIEMTVSGYHLRLVDDLHEFSADSLWVSTYDRQMGAKKIRIIPVRRSESFFPQISVDCGEVSLNDADLKTVYHKRILPVSMIRIVRPDVKISFPEKQYRKQKPTGSGQFFDLVTAYLRGVYADKVRINNGFLNLQNIHENEVAGYFETGFNFSLEDFQLDSLSISDPGRFFFASGYNLVFSEFGMKLIDNLHQLDISQLTFSSKGNSALIDSLSLKPVADDVNEKIMKDYGRSEAYHVFVPRIVLQETNLHEAWFNNRLFIDSFQVNNPVISFENFQALKKKKTNLDEFFQLIFNYMEDIMINHLDVPEGKLKIVNHSRKGKTTAFDNLFSATLDNFRLNEEEIKKEKLLYADDFDFTISNQLFSLSDSVHFLRAGKIRFSSRESAIKIENALLYPDFQSKKFTNLKRTFQVKLPSIELNGVNLFQVFRKKEVQVNALNLDSPELEIYNRNKTSVKTSVKDFVLPFPPTISWLKISRLNLNNAKVTTFSLKTGKREITSTFDLQLNTRGLSFLGQDDFSVDDFTATLSAFRLNLPGINSRLDFKELNYNKLNKSISLIGANLTPQPESVSGNRIELMIPFAEFTGFDADSAFERDQYIFEKIEVDRPVITVRKDPELKTGEKGKFDLGQIIEPYADRMKIKTLYLNEAAISITGKKDPFHLDRFKMVFMGIDAGDGIISENLLGSHDFEFSTGKIERNSQDGFYRFSTDSVLYNSKSKELFCKSIDINPIFDREKFETLRGLQADYVQCETDWLKLRRPDLEQWFSSRILIGEELEIGPSVVTVFRNKRLPFNPEQRPLMPAQLLSSIKTPFLINSVSVEPSDIRYDELTEVTNEPGHIDFKGFQLKSGRITNMNPLPREFHIQASAKLMDKGTVKADFRFETNPPNYRHFIKGSLDSMELISLNGMIENTALLSIETGQLKRLDFELVNDNLVASGKLFFGFDDLKVSVLKPDESGFKKARIPSFIANSFVLPSRNPKDKTLEPVVVSYERDVSRSFLNFWWKALYSGVRDVLGIKEKDRKKN